MKESPRREIPERAVPMTEAPVLEPPRSHSRPEIEPEPAGTFNRVLIGVFTVVPFLALLAAVPFAWQWNLLGWSDIAITAVFYFVSAGGITVGFHRYFTHGSFKAVRPLRIA